MQVRPILTVFFVVVVTLIQSSVFAADTTVKGTTSDNTVASLEVTNSSNTSLMFVRNDGNVGVGDATPASMLTVGSGDLFQVNSSGDIVKIENVTYNWPNAQGAASTVLTNDSAGNLTWSATGSGSAALSSVTAATTDATIGNGANNVIWNWALTGATEDGFIFGESAASTGGSGEQSVLKATTAAASTAVPLIVTNLGVGLSFRVNDAAGGTDDGDTTPVVVDASGNVGVGTTAPESLLEAQGAEATDASLTLDADDGDDNADTWFIKSEAADNDLSFVNHATELMKITSAGVFSLSATGLLDLSGIDASTTSEGFKAPQNTTCAAATAEGQLCWDTDGDSLFVGSGSAAAKVNALRVSTTASTATLTPEVDNFDLYTITAQAAALTIANHATSTPVEGQKLLIRIKDNGTARAITFGAEYRASSDLALPTTTVLSKTLYLGFIWNSADSKFDLLALLNNF